MSLTGNLEDLPLLDILQIVSFSKKTGHLSIETPEGEGAIVFRDGFVVCCFTPGTPPLDARSAQLQRPQLDALIRSRIEMALERLIRLHEGQFNFSLTDEPPRKVGQRDITYERLEVGINPQELVLDLARGIDDQIAVAEFVDPPVTAPVRSAAAAQQGLHPGQQRPQPVGQAIDLGREPPFEHPLCRRQTPSTRSRTPPSSTAAS